MNGAAAPGAPGPFADFRSAERTFSAWAAESHLPRKQEIRRQVGSCETPQDLANGGKRQKVGVGDEGFEPPTSTV